jgi:transposase InsO family protein
MTNNLKTELVLDTLNMAIYTRRHSPGLIHHSDRGSQYTSVEFGGRLREEDLLPSMGSVADAYDNSVAESFVSTFQAGIDPPPLLAASSEGENGDLRIHRGLLQHQKEAFSARAPQPFRVRRG